MTLSPLPPPTHFQVELGGSGLGLREGGEQPPPAAVLSGAQSPGTPMHWALLRTGGSTEWDGAGKKKSTETGDVGHGLSILTNVPLIQDVSTRGSGHSTGMGGRIHLEPREDAVMRKQQTGCSRSTSL